MFFNLDKYDYIYNNYQVFYEKAINKQLNNNDLKSMYNDITYIKKGVFCFNELLTLENISFPNCSYIGSNAFYRCVNLKNASFPTCNYIGEQAFYSCFNLKTVSFPECSYVGSEAFRFCYNLNVISLPKCSLIEANAFQDCNLSSLYLLSTSMCVLNTSNVFWSYATDLKIYVPSDILDQYKTASNWSYLSSKIYGG